MNLLLNRVEVEKLLQRYIEGETTLDEERQIRTWFSENEVPCDLLHYKVMLDYYSAEMQTVCPPEKQRPNMKLYLAQHKMRSPRRIIYIWTSVAATLILVALSINYMRIQKNNEKNETILAKQNELNLKTFSEMSDVLIMVSNTLNKGLTPVADVAQATDISAKGGALAAVGDAFSKLNKVTAMLFPPLDAEDENQILENSGI